MSFIKISLVGAAVLGTLLASASYGAESNPEALAQLMNQHGVRKVLNLTLRQDLNGLVQETVARAKDIGDDCEVNSLSEVHITNTHEWIAGYEAYVYCEDSPSPAVGIYYDVNQTYLGSLSLSN